MSVKIQILITYSLAIISGNDYNWTSVWEDVMTLTHLSLACLWGIGKQNSPRCDAAECSATSGAILFA